MGDLAVVNWEAIRGQIQVGKAHGAFDFVAALGLFSNWLAPSPNVPWCDRPTIFGRILYIVVRCLVFPLIIPARLMDRIVKCLWLKQDIGNTYRVIARKPVLEAS